MSSYSCFTTREQFTVILSLLFGLDQRVMLQSVFQLVEHHEGIHASGELSLTRALEILS